MVNSIERRRFPRNEIEAMLASKAIREGPLSPEKAGGILDLAASTTDSPILTLGFAQHANQVMGELSDRQLVENLVTWNNRQGQCSEEWVAFMRGLNGRQRSQIVTTLQAVRKSQDGIDVGTVRDESALGELTKRPGISVVRQAFLYIATKKI